MTEPTKPQSDKWRTWDEDADYGKTLFRRATGDLEEMESSKAAAKRIRQVLEPGETLLDVGCGAGHYLRSIRREIGPAVDYQGVDATASYVELARQAFGSDSKARFVQGDIFALPFEDRSFDVVMCNNVLLHLPSIAIPLRELVRVARKFVLVRLLCAERTQIVRDVHAGEDELDENGETGPFHFFNIYSERLVRGIVQKQPGVARMELEIDRDFDAARINDSARENDFRPDSTRMLGSYQVNGAILQPWQFLSVWKQR